VVDLQPSQSNGGDSGEVPSLGGSRRGNVTDQRCSSASTDDLASAREFDYGITDERYDAARRARIEVAASIRRAAAAEASASAEVRRAFETAARLAEGGLVESADEKSPSWPRPTRPPQPQLPPTESL
jgi:hypothetical protein